MKNCKIRKSHLLNPKEIMDLDSEERGEMLGSPSLILFHAQLSYLLSQVLLIQV